MKKKVGVSATRELRSSVSDIAASVPQRDIAPSQNGAAASTAKRIAASAVRNLCGGVSDMTLWRWQHDPKLNFPDPIYIARRRYWREADVIAWLDAQGADLAA